MILEIMRTWKIRFSACSDRFCCLSWERRYRRWLHKSNDVVYVLFMGEGSGKGNSKDLGRRDPFNAGKQRRKGSIRKA